MATPPLTSTSPSFPRAQEYLEKYHLDEDAQPSSLSIDVVAAAIADFKDLPPADGYAVFVRLRQLEEWQVLNAISGFEGSTVAISPQDLLHPVDEVLEDLRGRLAIPAAVPQEAQQGLWNQRLAVAVAVYTLEAWVKVYGELAQPSSWQEAGWHLSVAELMAVQTHIGDALKELYAEAGGGANPLWDSDRDFEPFRPSEDAFDDRDCLPFDPRFKTDTDGDGIADAIDARPANPAVWSSLKIGASKTFRVSSDWMMAFTDYTVTRSASHAYTIGMTLRYGFSAGIGPDDFSPPVNAAFLEKFARRIHDAFPLMVAQGPDTFALNMRFLPANEDNPTNVNFTPEVIRVHASLWDAGVLVETVPKTAVHEIGHHLGFPDYYHEPFVDDSMRDRTFQPGYRVLGAHHMMSDKTAFPVLDLAALAQMTVAGIGRNSTTPWPRPYDTLADLQAHLRDVIYQGNLYQRFAKQRLQQTDTQRRVFETAVEDFVTVRDLYEDSGIDRCAVGNWQGLAALIEEDPVFFSAAAAWLVEGREDIDTVVAADLATITAAALMKHPYHMDLYRTYVLALLNNGEIEKAAHALNDMMRAYAESAEQQELSWSELVVDMKSRWERAALWQEMVALGQGLRTGTDGLSAYRELLRRALLPDLGVAEAFAARMAVNAWFPHGNDEVSARREITALLDAAGVEAAQDASGQALINLEYHGFPQLAVEIYWRYHNMAAAEDVQEFLQFISTDEDPVCLYGRAALREWATTALPKSASEAHAARLIADYMMDWGQFSDAAIILRRVLDGRPADVAAQADLVVVLWCQKSVEQAQAEFRAWNVDFAQQEQQGNHITSWRSCCVRMRQSVGRQLGDEEIAVFSAALSPLIADAGTRATWDAVFRPTLDLPE